MQRIEADEAERQYQITAVHHEMASGGELRFRLGAVDGTRYIRTERPASAGGGWQEAHFHRVVRETYIVQRGWIAFAECRDGQLHLRVLEAGNIVTTAPLVVHNVYMSAGAVIHTVKHGEGVGEDKESAAEFSNQCMTLDTEVAVRDYALSSQVPCAAAPAVMA